MTSAQAVNKLKRLVYPQKIGHMGTLDPDADGVLPIAVGKATRLFDLFLDKRKTYRAVFTFGVTTDTLDASGKITQEKHAEFSREQLEAALSNFVGRIEQMPPKFSAKNINGTRAYVLARAGAEFELKPKTVEVYSVRVTEQFSPTKYGFEIECGGGTFIRSLARDIAEKLGTCGYMEKLTRTACGGFSIDTAVNLKQIAESGDIASFIMPIDCALDHLNTLLVEDAETQKKLLDGVPQHLACPESPFRIKFGEKLIGLGECSEGLVKIKVNLNEE